VTPRERFAAALDRKAVPGRVPTFELVFFLTMETLGRVHPSQRHYSQWDQMKEKERGLHRRDMADLYIKTAERFEHDAVFLHPNPSSLEETVKLVRTVRELSGGKYFIMLHGDATFGIPSGSGMLDFSYRIADDPEGLKKEAAGMVDNALRRAETLKAECDLDGFALCSDYCLNDGPFFSPSQFSEFVTPYLSRLIKGYRGMGFYTIKHTDGNIMPIIDQLVQAEPHALHSLDPQGGVDIAEVKRLYGKQICLIGNVNCALMDSGTVEEAKESARYAIRHGKPGGGYIFSTSNCVYTGMDLSKYGAVLDVWREEG
jgi:uroporphyrinogen decarboxylase